MKKKGPLLEARSIGPIYGNLVVEHPDGTFMYRCLPKKINWYLKRDLASVIEYDQDANPIRIRLNFEPKGRGNAGDTFLISPKENRCVCCGTEENLTRHHVIPRCYKRCLPLEYKTHDSHDVVPLCVYCHWSYEQHAEKLKQWFAKKYNAPFHGLLTMNKLAVKAGKAANTLRNASESLPEFVRIKLENIIKEFLNKDEITAEDLQNLKIQKNIFQNDYTHGKIVMSNISDLQQFHRIWREHFLEYAKPQFLPNYWRVDRPIKKTW